MIKSKIEDKSQSSILKEEEKKEQEHSEREKNNEKNNDNKDAKKKIKNTKGDRGCGIGRSTRRGRRSRGRARGIRNIIWGRPRRTRRRRVRRRRQNNQQKKQKKAWRRTDGAGEDTRD